MIKLSVVIVLYNEYKLIEKTLLSIYQNKIEDMEVIVVDNSEDNKLYKNLLDKFPNIIYFHSRKNLGFAGGVNAGIKKSIGEYILVLTPDMYIEKDTISQTLNYISSHNDVGLVGCRHYSSPKVLEKSANFSYPNLFTVLFYYNMPLYKLIHRIWKDYTPNHFSLEKHKEILNSKWVNGQYMLLRKKALDGVGNFDTRFFLYFEDVDLCKRLVEHNWKVVYLPVGGVVQNGITKWKKTKITQALSPFLKSLYRFFIKYNGKIYTIVAWIIAFLSVLVTIPYLVFVFLVKSFFGKKSQSKELLPLWIDILKWHLMEGRRIVFTI